MINESVEHFSHSTSCWSAAVMWVTAVGKYAAITLQPPLWSCLHTLKQGTSSCRLILLICCFYVLSSLKSQLQCSKSDSWEPAHIKIQVQGREGEWLTLWACGTTCETVVCQWLLSQLIIELGKRSIVPVRWSHFQLAAYWDSNLWQY